MTGLDFDQTIMVLPEWHIYWAANSFGADRDIDVFTDSLVDSADDMVRNRARGRIRFVRINKFMLLAELEDVLSQ